VPTSMRPVFDAGLFAHSMAWPARLARDLGLSAASVRASHLSFLAGLARAAGANQVITRAQRPDLVRVAGLLDRRPGHGCATLRWIVAADRTTAMTSRPGSLGPV
jgi:hypothetical protein